MCEHEKILAETLTSMTTSIQYARETDYSFQAARIAQDFPNCCHWASSCTRARNAFHFQHHPPKKKKHLIAREELLQPFGLICMALDLVCDCPQSSRTLSSWTPAELTAANLVAWQTKCSQLFDIEIGSVFEGSMRKRLKEEGNIKKKKKRIVTDWYFGQHSSKRNCRRSPTLV